MKLNREQLLELSLGASVAAGKILLSRADDVLRRSYHQPDSLRDVATEIDQYAEQEIIKTLRQGGSEAVIVAEESGFNRFRPGQKLAAGYWLVDPLDGTVNYLNHLPWYAVSVAWIERHRPIVGAVFLPALGELYYGAKGLGVFKNQAAIKIKNQPPTANLFAASFSGQSHDNLRGREFSVFGLINDQTMGCLRTGSAAINLAYLAAGRLGGCFGRANKFWDVAAGLALAELAGARVDLRITDQAHQLVNYLAAVPACYDFLKQQTQQILEP